MELKLWYGEHEEAYEQLYQYLENKNAPEGYLLTFDFREKKQHAIKWISYKNKRILDGII